MSAPAEAPLPDVREAPPKLERMARDTAMIQGFLLLVLFSSTLLPWNHGRNVFEEARHDSGAQAVATMHFGIPLITGALTFARVLRGRVPQKPSFWLVASLEITKAVLAVLATAWAMFQRYNHSEGAMALFGALTMAALIFTGISRGAARDGWLRWTHLLAAILPWHLVVAGLLYVEMRSGRPAPGLWLYFASVAALFPVGIWAVWPHKSAEG